jgi:hypothetical protein
LSKQQRRGEFRTRWECYETRAREDAQDAIACAVESGALLAVPDAERLAGATAGAEAARHFGAAEAYRELSGIVRFKVYQGPYEASVAALREALDDNDIDAAWAEGAALPIEEAIGYAQRGRGERKRAGGGWASLTPAELDVARRTSTPRSG